MADMVPLRFGGPPSSTVPDRFRVLKRVAQGTYCLIETPPVNVEIGSSNPLPTDIPHDMRKAMLDKEFLPFHLVDGKNLVRVWATEQLKFENRPEWQEIMRCEVRSRITGFAFVPSKILHGVYMSSIKKRLEKDNWDIDNVLFYNVSESYFGPLRIHGFKYEHSVSEPPRSPKMLNNSTIHYYHYRCVDKNDTGFSFWIPSKRLAQFSTKIPYESMRSMKDCHVWWHLRHGKVELFDGLGKQPRPFGLRITVCARKLLVSRLFKQITDGAVALFQQHDGTREDKVAIHLADELHVTEPHVLSLLRDNSTAMFGKGNLFSKNYQMLPCDKFCFAGEINHKASDKDFLEIYGELFEIEEKPSY